VKCNLVGFHRIKAEIDPATSLRLRAGIDRRGQQQQRVRVQKEGCLSCPAKPFAAIAVRRHISSGFPQSAIHAMCVSI
jgi:hypothetical protein